VTPFVAERRALKFSAISASLFAFTGLALGLTSGSITILFDSGYSLLSLVLGIAVALCPQAGAQTSG